MLAVAEIPDADLANLGEEVREAKRLAKSLSGTARRTAQAMAVLVDRLDYLESKLADPQPKGAQDERHQETRGEA